jgi:WXG100 family type VII secretion target
MTTPGVLWGTPEDLATAARAADASVQNILGFVGRVESQVNVLMASWMGNAPVTFIAQHENWRNNITALMTELTRIGEGTNVNGQLQRNADDMSQQAVSGPVATGLKFA